MDIGLIAGIGVTVVAVLVAIRHFSEARRSRDLARVAAGRGLLFEGDGLPFSGTEIAGLLRFNRRGQRARNIMRGAAGGFDMVLFDHLGQAENRRRRETVAAFRASAPEFELTTLRHGVNPNVMAPVFARLGLSVMCFASHPEFCRDYLLVGREENNVRALFTPALLTFLDGLDKSKRWAVESGSGWLLVCCSGICVPVRDLGSFIDDAAALAAAIAGASAAAKA